MSFLVQDEVLLSGVKWFLLGGTRELARGIGAPSCSSSLEPAISEANEHLASKKDFEFSDEICRIAKETFRSV